MQKRLEQLKKQTGNQYWAERIVSELTYLRNLLGDVGALAASVGRLETQYRETGAITKQAALAEEAALAGFGDQAKRLSLVCAAHAHIDMNWMWSMPETVNVTIDTFQTMLDLMEEYPAFTFTQSQASTYQIVEQFAPSMLEPIKRRVREGRWEVAATHWVEPDKNMISAESMARHLLCTKRYLSKLLDIPPDSLQLDYEPDTFGHPTGVPEVLSHAGVKYMYHCRGNEEEEIYRFRAPSGAEVLTYREPNWYNNEIEHRMTAFLPAFCKRNHVKGALKVYGVGDHGGGPTRRDIERLLDMQSWPLLPEIRFGRIDEYFRSIESNKDKFPVVGRELNFVFTGCYTSQSRIKRANRIGEDHLYDAEALHCFSRLAGAEPRPPADFTKAWRNVLFNHFHDILPGSGVRDTREYALGRFQEADSIATGSMNRAMQAIAATVDTSALGMPAGAQNSPAEGAGAGHGVVAGAKLEYRGFTQHFNVSDISRGGGDIRAFVLFNTAQYPRRERVQLTLWDWDLPLLETAVYAADKTELPFDVVEDDQRYWGHRYAVIAFTAEAPPLGYATVYIARAKQSRPAPYQANDRVHHRNRMNPVLENGSLRAEFDRRTLALISLTDKRAGKELLGAPAQFRLIREENVGFFSAWEVGRYGTITNVQEENFVHLKEEETDALFPRLRYELSFGRSALHVRVTLDNDMLRFSVELNWREESAEEQPVPQLQFTVPYAYKAGSIRCDAAVTAVDRKELNHDIPAHLYAAPVHPGGGLMLTTDCKYGYRAVDNALSISLIRSSHSPDKLPETGVHTMELGIAAVPDFREETLHSRAFCFSHPVYARSAPVHRGSLPPVASLLNIKGGARVTAVKPAENGTGILVRMVQNGGREEAVALSPAAAAETTDILENAQAPLPVQNGTAEVKLKPHTLHSVCITQKE
ncbi:MAG: hypothetical protein JW811_00350 [Clostridiales bacterium]|nr:hypothetical protein [Clostridiales bacterium]